MEKQRAKRKQALINAPTTSALAQPNVFLEQSLLLNLTITIYINKVTVRLMSVCPPLLSIYLHLFASVVDTVCDSSVG